MKSRKLERELERVPPDLRDLFRAVRKMNTFVCEICHEEELRSHPQLGDEWSPEWYVAMTELAHRTGWVAASPSADRTSRFFEEFEIIGPRCSRPDATR